MMKNTVIELTEVGHLVKANKWVLGSMGLAALSTTLLANEKFFVAPQQEAKRLENQVTSLEIDRDNLRNDRCRDGLVAEVESRNDPTLLGRQWIVHATPIDPQLPDYSRYGMSHVGCAASSLDKEVYRIRYMVPTRDGVVNGPGYAAR